MSMTFLQLASRLRQEVGGSGTGPTSVTSQVGEYKRFVDWIVTADEDIQRMHNEWLFMRGSFTINTVIGTGSYAAADCTPAVTDLRDWRKDTIKIYPQASGVGAESAMLYIEYQNWYDTYNTGTQSNSTPLYFTTGNDQSLKIAPKPSDVFVISGEYQKSVDSLSLATDTPNYPAEYHMLAVYRAMIFHGYYLSAPEIIQRGKMLYKEMLRDMRRTQLPRIKLGAPLV